MMDLIQEQILIESLNSSTNSMLVLYVGKIILNLKKNLKRFFPFKDVERKRQFPSKNEKW
jgi:hypothetical protein